MTAPVRGLAPPARALVRLSAALAAGDPVRTAEAMREAHSVCATGEVEEALLQSYLFLGYPAALNALAVWREVSGAEAPPPEPPDWDAWTDRGRAVCGTVYGGQYERLRRNVRALSPDLEAWMVTEGYGKVLGRPGLDLRERELCIVAILAVQGESVRRQLYSHLRGALQAGAGEGAVDAALDAALEETTPERAQAARSVWAEVLRRR